MRHLGHIKESEKSVPSVILGNPMLARKFPDGDVQGTIIEPKSFEMVEEFSSHVRLPDDLMVIPKP